MEVKHKFVTGKGDGPDTTRLRPSNWNDTHDVTFSQSGVVMGRITAGAGDAEEVSFASLLPAATVLPSAAVTPDSGWALCYGQAVSRAANPRLFNAIGTTYGPGDGATTMNVPDLRGLAVVGRTNMGGVDRGNLTGGAVLGAVLGQQTRNASISGVLVSGGFTGNTGGSLSYGGQTGGPDSVLSRGDQGGGTNVASQSHTHSYSGTTSGTLFCSGTISGTANGNTALFSIVQPSGVLNFIINLG